jgi:hypothetical protein
MIQQAVCTFHDVRLSWTYDQKRIGEVAVKCRTLDDTTFFKGHLKTLYSKRLLIDSSISIESPQPIVVVVISAVKQIEIDSMSCVSMLIEYFTQCDERVFSEIPKGSIQVEKKVLVLFQKEMPKALNAVASSDKDIAQMKKAIRSLG